jgi:hypothetical protein
LQAHTFDGAANWLLVSEKLAQLDPLARDAAPNIIGSGRVRVRAIRSDHPGSSIPEPVEKLLAEATRVEISGDEITATYGAGANIPSILGPKSNVQHENVVAWVYGKRDCTIELRAARVFLPDLDEELAAAGYAVPGKQREPQIKEIAWAIAEGFLERGEAPPRGHGRQIRLARMVNKELGRRGVSGYEDDSIRKMISPDIREWEKTHPGK